MFFLAAPIPNRIIALPVGKNVFVSSSKIRIVLGPFMTFVYEPENRIYRTYEAVKA